MTDLTPILNELLKSHDAPPTIDPSLALRNIDEFLKEAYRIVCPNSKRNRSSLLTQAQECAYSFAELLLERHKASLPFNSSPTKANWLGLERRAIQASDRSSKGGD
jgi:hypothetical protein